MERERFADSPIGSLVDISGIDGRFGDEYRHIAFVPDVLEKEPELTSGTWRAVANARAAIARLDQASRQLENASMLRRPTLSREAQSTSALEGTFAPLEQVIAADTSKQVTKEVQEVINYIIAANFAFDAVKARPHISVGLLEEVHRILVRGTDADTDQAGRVRTVQVAIGSPTGAVEDARFVPMPPGTLLNMAMNDFMQWVSSSEPEIDPIVAAAMAHYQFETVHPFNDGNGRIGRLLIVLQFLRQGILEEPVLSVSPWFEARRTTYQELLSEVSATGNWDAWVKFFSEGIESSANDVVARVDRLLEIHHKFVVLLRESSARGVIRDIVDELIANPIVSVIGLVEKLGKTTPAISSALDKLVELNIVNKPEGVYGRRYIAPDVLATVLSPVGALPSPGTPLMFEKRTSSADDGKASKTSK